MLLLIDNRAAKRDAQKRLAALVARKLPRIGRRRIGFPSGVRPEIVNAAAEGGLYCTFASAADSPVARSWNAFGVYESARHALNITVEINIPTTSNSGRVAGFLSRDPVTDREYLMHDGSIGGGKKGVGRGAYLAWSNMPLERVALPGGGERAGILVCDIDSEDAVDRLWRFVQSVRAFKDAIAAGVLETPAFQRKLAEYERYNREFSGRKTGRRGSVIDYVSYHGDVVEALRVERAARATPGETIFNSQLIDLYVKRGQRLIEVFEVKSRCNRQSVYTAIGQLITHAPDASIARIMVLPPGRLADDLLAALAANGITLRRYRLAGSIAKTVRLV